MDHLLDAVFGALLLGSDFLKAAATLNEGG